MVMVAVSVWSCVCAVFTLESLVMAVWIACSSVWSVVAELVSSVWSCVIAVVWAEPVAAAVAAH